MDIRKEITDAEYVIVGIGELFGYDWKKLSCDKRYVELCEQIGDRSDLQWVIPFLQKVSMDAHADIELKGAYSKLAEMTEGKDCYFVTTTIDDYIYNLGFARERIVTPCGGYRQLQCEKGCTTELINLPFALLQYVQKLYNDMIQLDDILDKYPECPLCGANLVFNQIGYEPYIEEGYLSDWGKYQKWLEQTMNRDTLLVELGVGLGFMSVIRSPFERMVTYNKKARMIRVHPSLYMSAAGMDDRCISVAADPKAWMNEIG